MLSSRGLPAFLRKGGQPLFPGADAKRRDGFRDGAVSLQRLFSQAMTTKESNDGVFLMKGAIQAAKGHIEEVAGDITGSKTLIAKGQKDQAEGHARQDIEKNVQKVKDSAKEVVDKTKCMAKKVVDNAECMAKKADDRVKGKA